MWSEDLCAFTLIIRFFLNCWQEFIEVFGRRVSFNRPNYWDIPWYISVEKSYDRMLPVRWVKVYYYVKNFICSNMSENGYKRIFNQLKDKNSLGFVWFYLFVSFFLSFFITEFREYPEDPSKVLSAHQKRVVQSHSGYMYIILKFLVALHSTS